MEKKKNLSFPMFIWCKKTLNHKGQEVKNTGKIMFRFRIYERVEERGDMVCYKLKTQ